MSKKLLLTLFIFLNGIWLCGQNFQEVDFPVPSKSSKSDTIFNTVLTDFYSWMKDKDSIYVLNHLMNENEYAERKMSESKLLRLKLYEEMKGRMSAESVALPAPRDSFNYYSRYEKGSDYPIILRKKNTSDTANEEVVFDMNSLKKKFLFFIPTLFQVSPNHEWFAYGVDDNGDREVKLFFQKIGADSALTTNIPRAAAMVWASDNQHIYYLVADSVTKRQNQLFRYKIGSALSSAELILDEPHPEYQLNLGRSASGEYIFVSSSKTDTSEFYIIDAFDPKAKPSLVFSRNLGIEAQISHEKNKKFYMLSNHEGLNFGLYSSDSLQEISAWQKLVAPKKDTVLQGFTITKDYFLIDVLADAQNLVLLYSQNGVFSKTIEVSEALKADASSNPYDFAENKIRFSHTSFLEPEQVFDYWIEKDSMQLIYTDTLQFDFNPNDYTAKRIYVTARDGAQIPVSVMYRNDVDFSEPKPLHLNGYGAYGITITPSFSRQRFSYLDRGFAVAIAHIRGSSAKGKEWHNQGKMFNKLNSFYDFIDVAKHFHNEGMSSPKLTVIQGGSAGGLLVTAALNLSPETFGCALANVPFVDVINTMRDDKLPLTTFEYLEWGNPNIKEQFDYMLSYSPYENIGNKAYPPMLLTSGYHDSQVGYWEPAKYVARLREMKSDSNRVLFTTNMKGGHTGASGRYSSLKESAFEMAFVLGTLGFTENYVEIQGRVVDPYGNPFPMCNILIAETSSGTITNEQGYFSIDIRAYQNLKLVFTAMGFDKQVLSLDPTNHQGEILVKMSNKEILLREFEVKANAKDPAYGIIKNAIEAKKNRNENLLGFETEIYIKNTGRLNDVPEKLPFIFKNVQMPDSNDLGLLGVSESISAYYFEKPNKVKESMKASIHSGTQSGFSWNRASDVLFDFYQNHVSLEYYSQRPFLSPIASTALFNYKFELVGILFDGDKAINRIKVIPRRKGDPLFEGFIEIRENTWDIYSFDLRLTKDAQIEFVDTVWIKQDFIEVDGFMMPLQVQMSSNIEFLGFKGIDLTVGTFTNYKVNPSFNSNVFSRQLFSIESSANKKTLDFWEENRGTKLTDEESKHYKKADSTMLATSTPEYYDSLHAISNKVSLSKILIRGYQFTKQRKDTVYRYGVNSLFNAFRFDPVQGFNPWISLSQNRFIQEAGSSQNMTLNIGYSFEESRMYSSFNYFQTIDAKKFSSFNFRIESMLRQYNSENPVPIFYDTYASLFAKQNYAHLLRNNEVSAFYRSEIANGLMGKLTLSVAQKSEVTNNSDFSFFNQSNTYNSQEPLNAFSTSNSFGTYARFYSKLSLSYQLGQTYESTPTRKVILPSKYPTLYFSYEISQGIRSTLNSQLMQLGTGKDFDLKLLGTLKVDVNSGLFLNNRNVFFPEYHHFRGNEILLLINESVFSEPGLTRGRNLQFASLDYYRLSTISNFAQAHVQHNFEGWLLGKIPAIRRLKWNAIVGANTLYTGDSTYTELYVGIANILKVIRVDFATGYEPGKPLSPAIRIGFGGMAI